MNEIEKLEQALQEAQGFLVFDEENQQKYPDSPAWQAFVDRDNQQIQVIKARIEQAQQPAN